MALGLVRVSFNHLSSLSTPFAEHLVPVISLWIVTAHSQHVAAGIGVYSDTEPHAFSWQALLRINSTEDADPHAFQPGLISTPISSRNRTRWRRTSLGLRTRLDLDDLALDPLRLLLDVLDLSLLALTKRCSRQQQPTAHCLRGSSNSHLVPDKVEPAVHGALGFDLVLLEQHRADKLVDVLAVLELAELALHAEVLRLLRLELLARGDDCLQFWGGVSGVCAARRVGGRGVPDCSFWNSSERAWSLACISAIFGSLVCDLVV